MTKERKQSILSELYRRLDNILMFHLNDNLGVDERVAQLTLSIAHIEQIIPEET